MWPGIDDSDSVVPSMASVGMVSVVGMVSDAGGFWWALVLV